MNNPPSNTLPELPADWHEKLQVGYGKPLTESEFKALMKSRQQSNPNQKGPIVVDYSVTPVAQEKTDKPPQNGH